MRTIVDGLPYPIVVSGDAPADASSIALSAGRRVFVVCDRNVEGRGDLIARALRRAGGTVLGSLVLEAGERRKRWRSVAELHAAFIGAGVDRGSIVLAVGGGTLTDVAGFAAGTFARGIPWLPVATTVLGMVDAAIGGKTGVDLPEGKNLIGCIWQPIGVVADVASLESLPAVQRVTGMAEIVKAAVVGDPELLALVAEHDVAGSPASWAGLIARAAAVKAQVVAADPLDRGPRAALNLGHTFAHAFEQASKYRMSHGAAVALGLRAAGILGRERTGWSQSDQKRVLDALRACGLKLRLGNMAHDDIIAAMRLDKKRRDGALRFVLPVRLGEVRVGVDVSEDDVGVVLATLQRGPGRGGP
jgi:3-dehydroquinate synthetase